MSHGLYLSLFMAGLVGGFTHCVTMCGPFVLSQTKNLEKPRQAALVSYHLGRITTYTIIAVLLASVLNLAFLFLPIRSFIVAPILFVAGLVFLVTAFPSLGKLFPWAVSVRLALPYKWLTSLYEILSQHNTFAGKYMLGVLLGFMPCGLIVSALIAAATASSVWGAAMAMVAFGVGTMPALISVALSGQFLEHKYPVVMKHVTQGMMVWSGLWLFALAGFILM